MKNLPLSLYIHYPWCEKKCPYCDFNSHTSQNLEARLLKNNYVSAVINDLKNSSKYAKNRELVSIFIGGGTPSLMDTKDLVKLFHSINKYYTLSPTIEITIEVNPSSASLEKFKFYQNIGINRISIGVQSFDEKNLQFLGRVHTQKQALSSLENAKQVFDNFNLDIIFGLQNQSVKDVKSDLKIALSFEPTHLSFYQLTIEPNTYFAKYPPILPSDEKLYQMMITGEKLLQDYGLKRYEVSAYGRPSKHNMNYWQFGDYIGIGAGAHGKISHNGEIFRTLKNKKPSDYINSQQAKITPIYNLAFDFMLNALRLKNGFNLDLFNKTTNLDLSSIQTQIKKAQDLGLITIKNNHLKPTKLGFNHLNSLQEIFL
jgi:oxygen-independent coproporphyrinogen-3 oxidase